MGEAERLIILGGIVVAIVLLLQTMLRMPRQQPQVPPTVAPMMSPIDEEVRSLRHWRANVDQTLLSVNQLAEKVIQHDQQIAAVRQDLSEIKGGVKRTEHQLNILIETAIKGNSA